MSTFVSVGNALQPFPRLLDAVAAVATKLPRPVIVQFGSGRFDAPDCDARSFVPMEEFERLIVAADLVILHGGGSIVQALRAGKTPVVMPRRAEYNESVDDHQVTFVETMAQTGRVVVVHDPHELNVAIDQAMSLQRQALGQTRIPELVRMVGDRLERYAASLR
jgi:UDP-N-acetylglucosamine transferase subunit ALG13